MFQDLLNHLISISTIKSKLRIVLDESRLRPIDADLQIPNTKKFHDHTAGKPEISLETMSDLLDFWRIK